MSSPDPSLSSFLAVAWVMSWFQAGGLIGGELRAAPSWPRVGCPQVLHVASPVRALLHVTTLALLVGHIFARSA